MIHIAAISTKHHVSAVICVEVVAATMKVGTITIGVLPWVVDHLPEVAVVQWVLEVQEVDHHRPAEDHRIDPLLSDKHQVVVVLEEATMGTAMATTMGTTIK